MNKNKLKDSINTGLSKLEYTADMKGELSQRIRAQKTSNLRLKPVLVITIVIILLFGVAIAATQMGLLRFLFGDNTHEASEDLLNSIQPLNVISEVDDISIHITGGLYDGQRFLVSWDIENSDPENYALVEVESIQFNGSPVRFDNAQTNDKVIPDPFETSKEAGSIVSGGVRGYVDDELTTDTPKVLITFALSYPVGKFVVVDESLYGDDQDNAQWRSDQQRRIKSADVLIAGQDELSVDEWVQKGFTVIDAYGNARHMPGAFSEDGHFFERPGQWVKSKSVSLSFSLDRRLSEKYSREANAFESVIVGDYSVVIHSISISPLSTAVYIECTPLQNVHQSEGLIGAFAYEALPWISFADEEGILIDYTNLDWAAGWEHSMKEDGSTVYRLEQVFPGLKKLPRFAVLTDGYSKTYEMTNLLRGESICGVIILPIQFD